jgi:hypothetical protein
MVVVESIRSGFGPEMAANTNEPVARRRTHGANLRKPVIAILASFAIEVSNLWEQTLLWNHYTHFDQP